MGQSHRIVSSSVGQVRSKVKFSSPVKIMEDFSFILKFGSLESKSINLHSSKLYCHLAVHSTERAFLQKTTQTIKKGQLRTEANTRTNIPEIVEHKFGSIYKIGGIVPDCQPVI